ncbi:hypothetical protein LDENG_00088430 [Lucifuga dentata]|nr:hypothetical protein LDENG_00088430 [Lucifuga dentata]
MVSVIQNTDVTQKDADHALVVAVTSHVVFESGADDQHATEVYGVGVAYPLLQALQRVNECLLEENPAETLLFDVILITTDHRQQQQRSRIISSSTHHSLDVGRFCFSSEEDFVDILLENKVQLFVSTDKDETSRASQRGIATALLDQETAASCPSEQLRVLLCGDAAVLPDVGLTPASQQATQCLLAWLGAMRQRFGALSSPLRIILLTLHGDRESCSDTLQTLRSRGVNVDEAYCLAGAPQSPILTLLQPHFLLSNGSGCLVE